MMEKTIKALLLFTSFIPIFVFNDLFFPHVSSKVFVFSLLVSVAGILFLIEFAIKKGFREKIFNKVGLLVKNPIFVSASLFVSVSFLSFLLASDKYLAFWGDIQRGEGFVSLVTLFSFLVLAFLNFEKKDWVWFFKLSLITTLVLLLKGFLEFFDGVRRPASFIGNPAFLAGYLLFSAVASLIVLSEERKNFWRYFSGVVLLLSVLGIFITQTRSAILGLAFGVLLGVFYAFFKGENVYIKGFSLRKISAGILGLMLVFSCVFFLTKDAGVWSYVPGLSRVAQIDTSDNTTSSRILVWKSSLEAVSLTENPKEFFVGWGLENSEIALSKYYNPAIYKFDTSFFDRSHNKFLDVLVMSGVFGLLAYLLVWFYLFRFSFKNGEFSLSDASVLFFAGAFLVHLMFAFDQTPTSIAFFAILSFSIYKSSENKNSLTLSQNTNFFTGVVLLVLIIFITGAFLRGNLVSFIQMRTYASAVQELNLDSLSRVEKSFSPFTPAQENIRAHFLQLTTDIYGNSGDGLFSKELEEKILKLALEKGDDYVNRRSRDFRFFSFLAGLHNRRYEVEDKVEELQISENYMRAALAFAPEKQEFSNNLVFNLMHQGRFEEALSLADANISRDENTSEPYYYKGVLLHFIGKENFSESFENLEKAFDLKPKVFSERKALNVRIYGDFLKDFYGRRDKENFVLTSNRLIENDYPGADLLKQVLEFVEKGEWPEVEFR